VAVFADAASAILVLRIEAELGHGLGRMAPPAFLARYERPGDVHMKLIDLTADPIAETIRKIGPSRWRIYSQKGKNLGTYDSLAKAKKRLGQIEFFKRQ
jgi:hypothetical protein